jgi:hypothetical protein
MRFSRLDLEHAFSAVPFIAVGATGAPRAAPARTSMIIAAMLNRSMVWLGAVASTCCR